VILPTIKVKAESENPEILVIYGPPKIGKTELFAALDDFLIIDLERGTNHLDALKVNVESLNELQEVGVEIMQEKKKTGKFPYKGIVTDTTTMLDEWTEWDATEEYMNSVIGQKFNQKDGLRLPRNEWKSALTLPKGAGYHWHRESFKKWFGKINKLAPYKIYACHVKDIYLEKGDIEVSEKDLDLTGKHRNILSSRSRAIGYLYRKASKPEELRISFQSTSNIGGSSCAHLRNQDFVIAINNEDGTIKEHFWNKIYLEEN
jgi:hypothetical protein